PARPIATNGDALLGAPWSLNTSMEYLFPEWGGRKPYLRLDYQHSTAQNSKLPIQDTNNAIFDDTLPGLPVANAHPLEFEARDIYPYPGAPGTGATQNGPTTDTLYFARGMRPRTIGVTAT